MMMMMMMMMLMPHRTGDTSVSRICYSPLRISQPPIVPDIEQTAVEKALLGPNSAVEPIGHRTA
eukprot:2356404-Amphidinium_carterae.1